MDLYAARLHRPQHGPLVSRSGWARLYSQSGEMRYSGQVAPGADHDAVAKYATVETPLRVAPASHLVSIATVSDHSAGFRFNVFDGAGRALFLTPVHSSAIGTPVASQVGGRQQFFLQSPWVVPPPGVVTVRISNLAAAENRLQVYLVFAEPAEGARNS